MYSSTFLPTELSSELLSHDSYQPEKKESGYNPIPSSQDLTISSVLKQKLQLPDTNPAPSSIHHPRRKSFILRNRMLERKTSQASLKEKENPLPKPPSTDTIAPPPSIIAQALASLLPPTEEIHQDHSESKLDISSLKLDLQEKSQDEQAVQGFEFSVSILIQEQFPLLLMHGNEDALSAFINKYIEPFPLVYNEVLKIVLLFVQKAPIEEMPLLTKTVATILRKMKSHYLLSERSLIEQMGSHNNSLSILTSAILRDAYASELIHFQPQQAREEALEMGLLCHTWFVPTGSFLLFLCEEALNPENMPKHSLKLLQLVHSIICQPAIYPVIYSVLFEAYRYFVRIPPDNEALAKIKADLLRTSKPLIKASLPVISRDSPNTFYDTVRAPFDKETPLQFEQITTAIVEEKVTSNMVRTFAWDLKKLEALLFTQITPSEFSEFKKNSQTELAPHIKAYIQHTNVLISSITSHILSFAQPKERAQCCMFYIQLIKHSVQIGNLNGAFTIVGALGHSSIMRLKRTWALINRKNFLQFEKGEKLFAYFNNYANYHQHVKKWEKKYEEMNAKRCLIPYFGQFLTHFTFIDEGNSTLLEDGHLNQNKVQLLAQEHAAIFKYQTILRSFKPALLNGKYSYDIEFYLKKENNKVLAKGLEEVFAEAYELSCQLESSAIKKEV